MGSNWIKILGLCASLLGFGASLFSDWVGEKKTEEMVEEKVKEALAKQNESESASKEES